jgi:small subunit ribosomal protein S16
MLKIRLQRVGRINSPSYRIIVAEHARGPKTGNFVEVVGTYDPTTKVRVLKADRIKYWISVGAQPSDTMHNMLITEGITTGKKINVLPTIVVAPAAAEGSSEAKPVVEEVAAPAVVESSGEAKEEAPAAEEVPVEATASDAATE